MELNPYELSAYDKAYKKRRLIEDEQNWTLGIYFGRAISSCFSKDKSSYPDKPLLSQDTDLATAIDPEANERLAVAEMQCWIALLDKQSNLPDTIMTDLD